MPDSAASAGLAHPEHSPAGTVLVLGMLSAFGPLSLDLYLPATPQISASLHCGQAATQLTVSACLAGLALGQLVIGPLSDSRGRRGPLLVGVASYALLSFGCALAPNIEWLILARVLQGLAGSAGLVISRAIVRDLYTGREAARIFATLTLITGVAPVIAPVLGGQLVRFTSWHGMFLALGGVGLLLLVAAWRLPETRPAGLGQPAGLRSRLRTLGSFAGERRFAGYALTLGLSQAALFSYIAASPFVIEQLFGLSAQAFSALFAINALGIMLAGQLSRLLVRRVGPGQLLRTALWVQVLSSTALVLTGLGGRPSLLVLMIPLCVTVATIGLVSPNATALAMAPFGATAGSASAQLGATQLLIGAMLSPLAGLGGHHSMEPMAALMCLLAWAASITYQLVVAPGRAELARVAMPLGEPDRSQLP